MINWLRGHGARESKLRQVARLLGVSLPWLRDGEGADDAEIATFRARLRSVVITDPNELRLARERHGLSLAALADRIGHPIGLLDQVECGYLHPSEHLVELLSRVLPTLSKEALQRCVVPPLMDVCDGRDATYDAKPDVLLPDGTKGRYVPLLTCAQAGRWEARIAHPIREHAAIFALEVEDCRAFAIRVLGKSMEPAFREGDMVVCTPSRQIRNGDAAVVRTRREQIFINYWRRRGPRVLIESANADYKPIDLPVAEITGSWPIVQTITPGNVRRTRSKTSGRCSTGRLLPDA